MCFHHIGENATNIIKINKDVPSTWKKKIGTMSWVGPWARPRKPLHSPTIAKILN